MPKLSESGHIFWSTALQNSTFAGHLKLIPQMDLINTAFSYGFKDATQEDATAARRFLLETIKTKTDEKEVRLLWKPISSPPASVLHMAYTHVQEKSKFHARLDTWLQGKNYDAFFYLSRNSLLEKNKNPTPALFINDSKALNSLYEWLFEEDSNRPAAGEIIQAEDLLGATKAIYTAHWDRNSKSWSRRTKTLDQDMENLEEKYNGVHLISCWYNAKVFQNSVIKPIHRPF